MQVNDIGWFAGLFEGEGHIYYNNRALVMMIGTTDRDVLEKVIIATGVGRIRGPRHDGNANHKPIYEWCLTSRNAVLDLAEKIIPYMGIRRTEQINRVTKDLERLREKRILKPSEPCGYVRPTDCTSKGAKQHIRRGEKPCSDCASAYKNYLSLWRNR